MSPTKANDGGRAFPTMSHGGMTLRDYFAAQALVGIIAAHQPTKPEPVKTASKADTDDMYHAFAATAYLIADAMLSERAK